MGLERGAGSIAVACGLADFRLGISLDVTDSQGRYEEVCETGQCLFHRGLLYFTSYSEHSKKKRIDFASLNRCQSKSQ